MSDIQNEAQELQSAIFLQNLVKLIPVEIIALFAIIQGFIPADANPVSVWVVLGILTVLVPFYIIFAMQVKKVDQIILMTLAFPIWVLAIGGVPDVITISWLEPWIISVALALFTLIPPMFYGKRVSPAEIENKLTPGDPVTAARNIAVRNKSWREV